MKKLFLLLTTSMLACTLTAQNCVEIVRSIEMLPMSQPNMTVNRFILEVPGETILDKGDSCLAILFEQFDTELTNIDVEDGVLVTNAYFKDVRFKQRIDGILIQDHGANFRFDKQGRLVGIKINLVLDSPLYTELEELASLGEPNEDKIIFTSTGYKLNPLEIEHIPLNCNNMEASSPINLEVSFPPYDTECREILETFLIPIEFAELKPLKVVSGSKLCGEFANPVTPPSTPSFQNGPGGYWWYECENTDNKHEALMAYYHLNFAAEFIQRKLSPFGPNVVHVLFDYAYTDDLYNEPVVSTTENRIDFSLTNEPNVSFHDIAEDADHVAAAAFEAYMVYNGISVPIGNKESVGAGTIAFLTWRYMVEQGYSHTNIGGWAGTIPVAITLVNELTEKDLDDEKIRRNASVWAGALYKIYDVVGSEEIMNELLMSTMKMWEDNTVTQVDAAVILHTVAAAMRPDKITDEQLYEIRCILHKRYPTVAEFGNHYIKDTKAGQSLPGGGLTVEDYGDERNDVSQLFHISPSIWNCTSSSSTCTTNVVPIANQTNYLHVLISNRSCIWPEEYENVDLEIYAAYTPTNERWPEDWGAEDKNNDGTPEDTYYYYDGHMVLVGKRIGVIDMNLFTEVPEEQARKYTLSWVPWNPFNKLWRPQLGYLARIVDRNEDSEQITEPFHEDTPMDGLAYWYTRDNNNVARRKSSIFLFAAGGPAPSPHVRASAMLGGGGITRDLDLVLSYVNTEIKYTDSNFDSLGTISLTFPPNLLDHYGLDLPEETGFDWVNDSTIEITSPSFHFPLQWDPDSIYQLQIRYTPSGTFQPVSFLLGLRDEEGCSLGSEHFTINTSGTTPRSDDQPGSSGFDFALFPNPALDKIHYSVPDGVTGETISILTATGQHVSSIVHDPSSQSVLLYGLSEGLYFMEMRLGNGYRRTKPFMVVR